MHSITLEPWTSMGPLPKSPIYYATPIFIGKSFYYNFFISNLPKYIYIYAIIIFVCFKKMMTSKLEI